MKMLICIAFTLCFLTGCGQPASQESRLPEKPVTIPESAGESNNAESETCKKETETEENSLEEGTATLSEKMKEKLYEGYQIIPGTPEWDAARTEETVLKRLSTENLITLYTLDATRETSGEAAPEWFHVWGEEQEKTNLVLKELCTRKDLGKAAVDYYFRYTSDEVLEQKDNLYEYCLLERLLAYIRYRGLMLEGDIRRLDQRVSVYIREYETHPRMAGGETYEGCLRDFGAGLKTLSPETEAELYTGYLLLPGTPEWEAAKTDPEVLKTLSTWNLITLGSLDASWMEVGAHLSCDRETWLKEDLEKSPVVQELMSRPEAASQLIDYYFLYTSDPVVNQKCNVFEYVYLDSLLALFRISGRMTEEEIQRLETQIRLNQEKPVEDLRHTLISGSRYCQVLDEMGIPMYGEDGEENN